jgi:GrpB-like predicted nucleotidyltransferase (UPF0157 family)
MDTAWIALIGTLFGGVVLKIVESVLARGSKKSDTATAMRDELRKESTSLREELRAVEKELDAWKEKYFLLLQDYLEIKSAIVHEPKEPKKDEW